MSRATWVLDCSKVLFWQERGVMQLTAIDGCELRADAHPSNADHDGVTVLHDDTVLARDEALALFDMHRAAAALRGDD